MSTAPTSETAPPTKPARNGAARASALFAVLAISAVLSFATVLGWMYPPFFLAVAAFCAFAAIFTGHVGRARGRTLGAGRGEALAAIITGWVVLAVTAIGVLVAAGVLAGIGAVTN